MIVARFEQNKVELSGHAGYAPKGQDIVCASVSALFGALVLSLDKYASKAYRSDIGADKSVIEWDFGLDAVGRLLIACFKDALEDIESQYPENVRVVENDPMNMFKWP